MNSDTPLGDATVTVDVDTETYHRLRVAFGDAVEAGYGETFEYFVLNHANIEYTVTVDGEPVDPDG